MSGRLEPRIRLSLNELLPCEPSCAARLPRADVVALAEELRMDARRLRRQARERDEAAQWLVDGDKEVDRG